MGLYKNYKYIIYHNEDGSIKSVYNSFWGMVYGQIRYDIYPYFKNKILKKLDKITNRHWVMKDGKYKLHLFCYIKHYGK